MYKIEVLSVEKQLLRSQFPDKIGKFCKFLISNSKYRMDAK